MKFDMSWLHARANAFLLHQLDGKDTVWNLRIAPPQDGRVLHGIGILETSSQTVDAVPSAVIEYLNCCLVFHDVCGGARHLRVNSPSWGALAAAYLWNSSNTTLILSLGWQWLDLCLSLSPPPWLSVVLALIHLSPPSSVLSSLLIFLTFLNYLASLSFCRGGDVYAGVRVLWWHL